MILNPPVTDNPDVDSYLFHIKNVLEDLIFIVEQQNKNGFTGTFTADTLTVTVNKGIITDVS